MFKVKAFPVATLTNLRTIFYANFEGSCYFLTIEINLACFNKIVQPTLEFIVLNLVLGSRQFIIFN